ncbi:DUF4404 family protein [Roseibacillus persicicus]|uniref:DUF4404 family protein n=1 Tax=Roseibacillus persicicus TaxID=454148 RepID=UPI00398A9259
MTTESSAQTALSVLGIANSLADNRQTMSSDNLQQEITQLRTDLQNLGEIDDATREELSLLEKRIEDLLDDGNEEETVPEKVISQIEETATNFAVQHPKAEGLLRRIAYALGRMGI